MQGTAGNLELSGRSTGDRPQIRAELAAFGKDRTFAEDVGGSERSLPHVRRHNARVHTPFAVPVPEHAAVRSADRGHHISPVLIAR